MKLLIDKGINNYNHRINQITERYNDGTITQKEYMELITVQYSFIHKLNMHDHTLLGELIKLEYELNNGRI